MKQSCIRAGDIGFQNNGSLDSGMNTFWKAPGVCYHMHQTSGPYHAGAVRNHYFGEEIFFCQRCCNTLFWPIGSCIALSPIRTSPRVGA
jgi:hypothetical protein